jgi:hypothetical protein
MSKLFWYDTEKMSIIISNEIYLILALIIVSIITYLFLKLSKINSDTIIAISASVFAFIFSFYFLAIKAV